MKKNILLKSSIALLGSVPLISSVSCAYVPSESEIKLNDTEVINLVQEKWWNKVIKKYWGADLSDSENLEKDENVFFKKSFDFMLNRKLMKSPTYFNDEILNNTEFLRSNAFQKEMKKEKCTIATQLLEKWNMSGYYLNGMKDNESAVSLIPNNAKIFLFQNNKKLRKEFYNFIISVTFLNQNIKKDEYKKVILKNKDSEDEPTLSTIQDKIDNEDFNLINESLEQQLYAEWKVKDDTKDAPTHEYLTNESFSNALKNLTINDGNKTLAYWDVTDKKESILQLNNILPGDQKINDGENQKTSKDWEINTFVGFNDFQTFKNTKLEINDDNYENAKSYYDFGFLDPKKKDKLLKTKIKYRSENQQENPHLDFLISLLPTYKEKDKKINFENTRIWPKGATTEIKKNNRLKLIYLLSEKNAIYEHAVKYFCNKQDPIKLKISYKKWRDFLKNEKGFEWVTD